MIAEEEIVAETQLEFIKPESSESSESTDEWEPVKPKPPKTTNHGQCFLFAFSQVESFLAVKILKKLYPFLDELANFIFSKFYFSIFFCFCWNFFKNEKSLPKNFRSGTKKALEISTI